MNPIKIEKKSIAIAKVTSPASYGVFDEPTNHEGLPFKTEKIINSLLIQHLHQNFQ
jgi:hypothetical protein